MEKTKKIRLFNKVKKKLETLDSKYSMLQMSEFEDYFLNGGFNYDKWYFKAALKDGSRKAKKYARKSDYCKVKEKKIA